jgi:hypothetical protein
MNASVPNNAANATAGEFLAMNQLFPRGSALPGRSARK